MAGIAAYPCLVKVSISSSFTTVEDCISISGPNLTTSPIETHSMNSTNFYKTFIPGWRDGGELTFSFRWNPGTTGQDYVVDSAQAATQTIEAWKLVFSDATECTFSGFVSSLSPTAELEETLMLEATVKITGAVVYP